MNSPAANWVFDYGAYLPVSGRQDNIYYRINASTFRVNSISIVNHNATDTGYWAGDGFHETGGNPGIKIVSNTSDSNWNVGTFTYTGATGSWDTGVNFGAANSDSSQAEITVGEMNIGYGENVTNFTIGSDAAGTVYATVESGDVKVGDPVRLSDSSGPKSLTITGDFNIHGKSTVNMNVYDNDSSAVHSEASPDLVVGGVVRMTRNGSGATPTWNLLYRTSTVSWATGVPEVPATNSYIKIGGLEGAGTVTNNSRTLEASTVKLIFANEADCEFTGGIHGKPLRYDKNRHEREDGGQGRRQADNPRRCRVYWHGGSRERRPHNAQHDGTRQADYDGRRLWRHRRRGDRIFGRMARRGLHILQRRCVEWRLGPTL